MPDIQYSNIQYKYHKIEGKPAYKVFRIEKRGYENPKYIFVKIIHENEYNMLEDKRKEREGKSYTTSGLAELPKQFLESEIKDLKNALEDHNQHINEPFHPSHDGNGLKGDVLVEFLRRTNNFYSYYQPTKLAQYV